MTGKESDVKKVDFLRQSIKNFQEMGTVIRSGSQMCRKMTQFIPKHQDVVIVELGAGDGAITEYILERMSKNSSLLVFEINPDLVKYLQKLADPRMTIINDGAQNLYKYLKSHKVENVDTIISAIPFLVLPEDLTEEILLISKQCLRVGGNFIQMHYATSMKKTYEVLFGNIETYFVPLNIPPGYVFKCVKEA